MNLSHLIDSNICPHPCTLIMRPDRAFWFCIIYLSCHTSQDKSTQYAATQYPPENRVWAFLLVFSYRIKLWSKRDLTQSAGSGGSHKE